MYLTLYFCHCHLYKTYSKLRERERSDIKMAWIVVEPHMFIMNIRFTLSSKKLYSSTELMMLNLVTFRPSRCAIPKMLLLAQNPLAAPPAFAGRYIGIVHRHEHTPHLHMVCNPKSCSRSTCAGPKIFLKMIQHRHFYFESRALGQPSGILPR